MAPLTVVGNLVEGNSELLLQKVVLGDEILGLLQEVVIQVKVGQEIQEEGGSLIMEVLLPLEEVGKEEVEVRAPSVEVAVWETAH